MARAKYETLYKDLLTAALDLDYDRFYKRMNTYNGCAALNVSIVKFERRPTGRLSLLDEVASVLARHEFHIGAWSANHLNAGLPPPATPMTSVGFLAFGGPAITPAPPEAVAAREWALRGFRKTETQFEESLCEGVC